MTIWFLGLQQERLYVPSNAYKKDLFWPNAHWLHSEKAKQDKRQS